MHDTPRTVTTNVATDAIPHAGVPQPQDVMREPALTVGLPGASTMQQSNVGSLVAPPAPDLLNDVLLCNTRLTHTASPLPSGCPPDLVQQAARAQQPSNHTNLHEMRSPSGTLPGHPMQRLNLTAGFAGERLPSSYPSTKTWDELASSVHQRRSPGAPGRAPLPFGTHTLLDDPLTASLITTQLSKPQPRNPPRTATHPPHPPYHPPSPPANIAKRKRKKIRPQDTIDALQQQIDSITSQIQHLTLRNHHIRRKKRVLGVFVQELGRIEAVAAEICTSVQQHTADPAATPPDSPAALQSWTPQRFQAAYKEVVQQSSQWILKVEEAGGTPSPAEAAELEGAIHEFLRVSVYVSYGRMDFMGHVMEQQLQAYSGAVPEEEHWKNVLAAMDLTEGQVEDLLVAREVYLQYSDTIAREHSSAVAALQQRSEQVMASGGELDSLQDNHKINKIAAIIRKLHTLYIILALFWFKHTLSPLQTARALMHAYPLIPGGMLMGNTLHALRGQAPSMPFLGPQPSPMATARTIAALQCATGSGPPGAAPPASSRLLNSQSQQ